MYDYDDEFDGRNARVVRRPYPPVRRPAVQVGGAAGYGPAYPTQSYAAPYAPPAYGQAYPWQPPGALPPASPLVDRYTGSLKLGLILDAAAQALAAMASLPTPPNISGDGKSDAQNLVKYQESLAQHAKRDEQIRTIGALARLFLV
jgi:hypothetical protein